MHQIHETLSSGAVIRGRYRVIDLIGKGGFSAVYLVRDQQREDSFFALKEAIETDKEARELFAFECSLLERLVHPALPRVHSVFEDEERKRLCMLMDYVEGPDLEMLRLIQPGKRFSLPVVTDILAPIVDAIAYLHQQDPPIIHRDIKPSNIIVPVVGEKAILVDFGIAKAFDVEATTSAVRHGSPGYGAPEHYSGGTNTRSDIYGLGATLYTMLTGEVPADAIFRMTQLSNLGLDPVKPVSELVPSIPLQSSRAVQRAMSINIAQRFATVQEFWQAFQGAPGQQGQQPRISEALNARVVSPAGVSGKTPTRPLPEQQLPDRRPRKRFLLPVLLALLLIVGGGAGYWGFTVLSRNLAASLTGTAGHPTPTPSAQQTVAATPTLNPKLSPHLAPSYAGTIDDLQANVPSPMTLTQVRLQDGRISGSFSALHISATYSGDFLDAQHFFFIVPASGNLEQLYFRGQLQADGSLAGQFCEVDSNLQCLSSGVFGVWSVAPTTASQGKLAIRTLPHQFANGTSEGL